MANDSNTTVLSLVAWGTKLTFGLYDFSGSISSASGDVNRLAKEVNLLSQVLRQIGSRLKEDGSLASQDAFNTVRQILDQCQDVFNEIEALIPVNQLQDAQYQGSPSQMNMGIVVQLRQQLDWNSLSQARVQYLLAHIDSLKLTLSVMLQTLYTAKASVWASQTNSPTAYDALTVERLQMESLIIEQQLALIRAYRMYEEFKQQVASITLAINQSPQSQALVRRDAYGPNPRALVQYQEPTLASMPFSSDENEDLPRIRMYSSPFVDALLSRWTRLSIVEDQMREKQPKIPDQPRDRVDRKNWEPSGYESDTDSEEEDQRRPQPKLRLSTNDPVLLHVSERNISSPMPASAASLRPPTGPFSPQPSTSWGPTSGSYFPQTPQDPRRSRLSPAPSPLSSPRVSFSTDGANLPQTDLKGNPPPPPPVASRRQPIPWRIRINQWYWDHQDNELVGQNHKLSPNAALKTCSKDTIPTTDIFQEHVSREAIRDRGHEYTKVQRERQVNGKTQLDTCYCIEGILDFREIRKLVELTERIRNPPPRSPRPSRSSGVPPSLDRSNTAPVQGNKFRDTHQRDLHRTNTSASNSSDDDEKNYRISRKSRDEEKRRSGEHHGEKYERNTSRTRRPKSGSKEYDEDKHRSRAKAQTLTKIAAGAGLATLLDGLPEMLTYMI